MSHQQPFTVIGFHNCDREVGLRVLNGADELKPSISPWDWLGEGIYFWEQNPLRALEYAVESSQKKQFNKIPIKIPFVLGANIDLGNCLNLVESKSIEILKKAFDSLKEVLAEAGRPMPQNKGNNRALNCAVIQYIHKTNSTEDLPAYDTDGAPSLKAKKSIPVRLLLPAFTFRFAY